MNARSMIIAAAVLATPACAVGEKEMSAASNDALTARISLQGETYLSRDTFQVTETRWTPDGQQRRDTLTVRYRLSFIPAGSKNDGGYSYDGTGAMEYEAVIERVELDKPELSFSDDVYYYAKRTGDGSFKVYNCDSSRNCSDQGPVSQLEVATVGATKTVTLSGLTTKTGISLDGVSADAMVFEAAAPAPAPATLPATVSCEGNGYALVVSPLGDGSDRAKVVLTTEGTGSSTTDTYNTTKNAAGAYVAAASWAGVRIAFATGTAHYENEVTGLAFDFPKNACR